MNHLTREYRREDIEFVCDHMRQADIEECKAGGLTPFDALVMSVNSSTILKTLITPDGTPGAIVGVADSPSPMFGRIWLLGTDAITHNRTAFLRCSRPALAHLYEESGKQVFFNYTFIENTVHHAWLRWLGFTFLRKVSINPHGHQFYEFVKIKGHSD